MPSSPRTTPRISRSAAGWPPLAWLPAGASLLSWAPLSRLAGAARDPEHAPELPDRTAADLMTPRVRTQVLRGTDSAADVIEAARRSGHSRFPVIGLDLDDVLGVVQVRAAVAVPRERRAGLDVRTLMTPALRLPETVRLGPLLAALRAHQSQLAVVLDEYGGTAGVVTLEDVVEELVGEVSDEHDRNRPGVVRRSDGSWLVPGLLRPDEIRHRTGVDLPEAPSYETVGGLLMARLGRVPRVGDEVLLPGAALRVERMDGRRVDRIRLAGSLRNGSMRNGSMRNGRDRRTSSGADPRANRLLTGSRLRAGAVLVALTDLHTVPAGCTPAAVEDAVARTGFSRFPVLPGDSGLHSCPVPIGYLHVKDLFGLPVEQYRRPLPSHRIRSLPAVPVEAHLTDVLAVMRRAGAHLALATDRSGRGHGVVFFDDVLAVLVSRLSATDQSRRVSVN